MAFVSIGRMMRVLPCDSVNFLPSRWSRQLALMRQRRPNIPMRALFAMLAMIADNRVTAKREIAPRQT